MYLRNYFLLSAIIGLAACVRVFDFPKSRGTENSIGRHNEGHRNNARGLTNTFRALKPSNESHVSERIKNSKNIGVRNKIQRDQANQQLERQRVSGKSGEETEQKKFGSEQASDGLGVWLKGLRNERQLPPDGDRIQFQIQGHKGPRTYIFGFDTGHGKNRQFRLEEMSENGTVTGQYGYYDSKGKLRTVEYIAKPSGGYNERHHETNIS